VVHRQGVGRHRRDHRRDIVVNVGEVGNGDVGIAKIDVDGRIGVERDEMDRSVADFATVDLERKQFVDDFEPRASAAGLVFGILFRVDEIQLWLVDDDSADDLAVEQRIPFDGQVHPRGGEQRHRHTAGRLVEADILDRIGPPPEEDVDVADLAIVHRALVDGAVDVPDDD
jgi:hypothetical protein